MKSQHESDDAGHQPAVMPILALGHVWPALAAAYTTTGSYNAPWPLLGIIVLTMGLVDSKTLTKHAVDQTLTQRQLLIHIKTLKSPVVREAYGSKFG